MQPQFDPIGSFQATLQRVAIEILSQGFAPTITRSWSLGKSLSSPPLVPAGLSIDSENACIKAHAADFSGLVSLGTLEL